MTFADANLAGEEVRLYADRALYWPRRRLLAIADLHLGKGDAFRRHGIALPRGGTALDLQRIDRLLEASGAATLLVLGDLLHAAVRSGAPWLRHWHAWRETHPGLDLRVVTGNHDRALRRAELGIADDGERCAAAPFLFTHDAQAESARDGTLHALGGHLHPVVRLEDTGLRARLPVFWLGARCSVLPAFTAFSGGFEVRTRAGDRLYACAGDRIVALPAAAYAA
jgi:uncharacterized protein